MGPWEEASLESLIHHWGDAYAISLPGDGTWLAQRRDTRETLRADSADELFDRIHADYTARPVPRQGAAS